jgi:putative FmdB family regulatory protein
MPLLDFECLACDARFEELVRGNADRPECPSCGGRRLRRRLSAFGVRSREGLSGASLTPPPDAGGGGGGCGSCGDPRGPGACASDD